MKKLTAVCLLTLLGATTLLIAGKNSDRDKEGSIKVPPALKAIDFPGFAKISLIQAVEIAVKEVSGSPLRVSLVKDDGYLVYELIIVSANKELKEVEVDSGNGKILEIEQADSFWWW